jgi:hypothetical protein
VGEEASAAEALKMNEMMVTFKVIPSFSVRLTFTSLFPQENLENFAQKYKKDINRNPEFRKQFQVMCNSIGVDPLASNKGFWAQLLGFGDFYYELAVQIIEICIRYWRKIQLMTQLTCLSIELDLETEVS